MECEDLYWGAKAKEAEAEGYISAEESEKLFSKLKE